MSKFVWTVMECNLCQNLRCMCRYVMYTSCGQCHTTLKHRSIKLLIVNVFNQIFKISEALFSEFVSKSRNKDWVFKCLRKRFTFFMSH